MVRDDSTLSNVASFRDEEPLLVWRTTIVLSAVALKGRVTLSSCGDLASFSRDSHARAARCCPDDCRRGMSILGVTKVHLFLVAFPFTGM